MVTKYPFGKEPLNNMVTMVTTKVNDYRYGLLVDDKSLVISQNGSRLEWQDLYTIVFVLSTVPVEINQVSVRPFNRAC